MKAIFIEKRDNEGQALSPHPINGTKKIIVLRGIDFTVFNAETGCQENYTITGTPHEKFHDLKKGDEVDIVASKKTDNIFVVLYARIPLAKCMLNSAFTSDFEKAVKNKPFAPAIPLVLSDADAAGINNYPVVTFTVTNPKDSPFAAAIADPSIKVTGIDASLNGSSYGKVTTNSFNPSYQPINSLESIQWIRKTIAQDEALYNHLTLDEFGLEFYEHIVLEVFDRLYTILKPFLKKLDPISKITPVETINNIDDVTINLNDVDSVVVIDDLEFLFFYKNGKKEQYQFFQKNRDQGRHLRGQLAEYFDGNQNNPVFYFHNYHEFNNRGVKEITLVETPRHQEPYEKYYSEEIIEDMLSRVVEEDKVFYDLLTLDNLGQQLSNEKILENFDRLRKICICFMYQ
jgi:hypothetical protein